MERHRQIRVGALEGFRDLVFELGGNPSSLLNSVGIPESLWETPDALIPVESYRAALNLAAKTTSNPRFGLLLSQRQTFLKFGAIGYLICHAPNFVTAMELLTQYLINHDTSTITGVLIEDQMVRMTHTFSDIGSETTIQQTDLGVGLVTKFIRQHIDPHWNPEAVYFSHSKPASTSLYTRVFRCPVYFDCDLSGIEFPESDLAKPLPQADAKLYHILKNYIEQVNQQNNRSLLSKVRQEIHSSLEIGTPFLEYVASRMNMTQSELQRALKRENTTFQHILEQERYGLARRQLRETKLPVSTISVMLGYAETAVFSRAFKRMSGMSPREWRKKQSL